MNSPVIPAKLFDLGDRPVGRPVINANDFQILERLGQDGVNAPSQGRLLIMDGNDDGKFRHGLIFLAASVSSMVSEDTDSPEDLHGNPDRLTGNTAMHNI